MTGAQAARSLPKRGRVAFLLDFDGTLAPIPRAPGRAQLPESTRSLLRRLSHLKRVKVAVVSGRRLGSVEAAVAVKGLVYAGNHGLEIEGPGIHFLHPKARHFRGLLKGIAREARQLLRGIAGAEVEDKRMSLAIHYRGVPRRRRTAFLNTIAILRRSTTVLPVHWRRGKMIWEVLPDVAWDKGDAAKYLLARFGDPYPVAVGDDRTDEDLFRAMGGRGLTLRVGTLKRTRAQACLRRQDDVRRLLEAAYRGLR